jgi:hypothetical protein
LSNSSRTWFSTGRPYSDLSLSRPLYKSSFFIALSRVSSVNLRFTSITVYTASTGIWSRRDSFVAPYLSRGVQNLFTSNKSQSPQLSPLLSITTPEVTVYLSGNSMRNCSLTKSSIPEPESKLLILKNFSMLDSARMRASILRQVCKKVFLSADRLSLLGCQSDVFGNGFSF